MPRTFSGFAEVRFRDRDAVLADLRVAAARARARYPEIAHVFLFGSLVRGDWTADSDADLIVVVRRELSDILERSRYQIFTNSIHTDTLVYSEREFEFLRQDEGTFVRQALAVAVEL